MLNYTRLTTVPVSDSSDGDDSELEDSLFKLVLEFFTSVGICDGLCCFPFPVDLTEIPD